MEYPPVSRRKPWEDRAPVRQTRLERREAELQPAEAQQKAQQSATAGAGQAIPSETRDTTETPPRKGVDHPSPPKTIPNKDVHWALQDLNL